MSHQSSHPIPISKQKSILTGTTICQKQLDLLNHLLIKWPYMIVGQWSNYMTCWTNSTSSHFEKENISKANKIKSRRKMDLKEKKITMKIQLEIKKNIHRLCSGFVLDLYKRKVVKIPLAEKGFWLWVQDAWGITGCPYLKSYHFAFGNWQSLLQDFISPTFWCVWDMGLLHEIVDH